MQENFGRARCLGGRVTFACPVEAYGSPSSTETHAPPSSRGGGSGLGGQNGWILSVVGTAGIYGEGALDTRWKGGRGTPTAEGTRAHTPIKKRCFPAPPVSEGEPEAFRATFTAEGGKQSPLRGRNSSPEPEGSVRQVTNAAAGDARTQKILPGSCHSRARQRRRI